jgi:hypothetical protein
MIDRQQESGEMVSARRRLIRGAFVAPTVLTLYSGGALAATSSKLRCVVSQNAKPITSGPAIIVDATNSTYVRVQLYVVGGVFYVRGQDLPVARANSLPTTSQAQVFDIAANALTGSPVTTPNGLAPATQYAVLRIDATGAVVGVGAGSGGSVIGKSCWTSFTI